MHIRVMIVDDHQLFSDGIVSILNHEPSVEVVATASNGKTFKSLLKRHEIDMVLLDISMPEMDGVATTRMLRKDYPDVKILIISMYNSPNYITQLSKLGVHGYVLKDIHKQELIKAIHTIYSGDTYYDQRVAKKLLDSMRKGDEMANFTDRELEIIRKVASLKKNQEIADELFISIHTVKTHRKNICTKTKTSGTAELIQYARDNDLID